MADNEVVSSLDRMVPMQNLTDQLALHVTLTFAQSLDAKIAGRDGKQLILSCKESMIMTHRLRSRHDAILVGIGTALNDNPQLNTRLLAPDDGGQAVPLPVILDSNLRFQLDSKLVNNYKIGKGRQPIVFTAFDHLGTDAQFEERRRRLEAEGVKVIPINSLDGKLNLGSLLDELQKIGIRSLMVEGGATVISSFLQSGLVHSLIVTVCPTIVGDEGIAYDVKGEVKGLTFLQTQLVGRDAVMVWSLPKRVTLD
ncbi:bacterial bifunctional deaminase-reductase [Fomitiporia mediterranea MF3/22]|uniref:bacterial bifunctional deaminase-reductase n=1 Tax=Fomitiporia mediterranea (strain MF3/22) TaxID=694068 RepID=UPI0004409154|nr:bacterial bifunctional deaminase-reductase [Fomitiporia mediterranea MF3/22]EJD04204.1 bacterial bifunctional deaminase-reductase [Fomitiporia mediterranea MF3/22]